MARKPFFSGNYGSALARVDTRPIIEAGRAQGQMFANMGKQIGGMIEQYGLNKEKRAELTDQIESAIKFNPEYLTRMTSTGDEAADKKAQNTLDKLAKGDLNLTELKGLAGDLAMMEKVDLKAEKEEDRKIARQQSLINQKLLRQEFNTNKELQELKKKQQSQKEKAFEGLEREADEIRQMIKDPNSGVTLDKLNARSQFLYRNIDLIKNRQIDPMKAAFSSADEYKLELDKLTLEEKQNEIKGQKLELTEKTKEAAKMPEFNDRASALASVKDLPEGVSASFKKFKDGFDVELQYKAKEFTDIPSVPGYPNYKKVGGFLYEADPKKKTLRKLDPEDFGEKSELLQNTIKTLTTKDVEQYGLAKFRGVRNDDGDYDVEDPASGETITIPFNQDLENRLIYLDGLRNKLKTQIDLDLTIR